MLAKIRWLDVSEQIKINNLWRMYVYEFNFKSITRCTEDLTN
jgi:hypothetical protein